MNKNTEFNQALNASGEKSNNRDKTMSCEEDTSQVTKKRKSNLLSTPRYVIMNTRDVKDLVQSRLYLVYSKYTKTSSDSNNGRKTFEMTLFLK